jgi:2,4-dienoyl-CoA reductase-like NADH-dependent reductase (Old Yellow Enzyme family)
LTNLFEPFSISGLELRNRFERSATWDATADSSGAVTDDSVALYRQLGSGGVGLIVTGYAFVSPLGQAVHHQYGVHTDDMIPGLLRLVHAAHQGGAKIALQIAHAGISSGYLQQRGLAALAVSRIPKLSRAHREMTNEDIEATIFDFATAALRAVEAGFDAVQFHGAHGYLMSQFISPRFNQRTDRWGGNLDNRIRFHLELISKVRHIVGTKFPLMIKFGVQDDRKNGLSLSEGVEAAGLMVEKGIDAIEVSVGFGAAIRVMVAGEPEQAYLRDRAAAVKQAVSVPVIAVGGIRSLEMAKDIVDSGDADLVSMCRPFIREPNLIARWQRGEQGDAKCISCNKCMTFMAKGSPLVCKEE